MSAALLSFPAVKPALAGPALRDWLDSQSRVVEIWIERLIAEGGDTRMIAVLDQHAAFLREAREAALT